MKRILFLLLLLILAGSVFSQSKVSGCYLKMIEPNQSNELKFANDSISFEVKFSNFNYFCTVKISNNTNNIIEVDWDKFLMIMDNTSYQILFDDTRMILKNASKGRTSIAPGTCIYRNIAPTDYIDYNTELFTKKEIKKRGNKEISFSIPIVFDNYIKIFNCKIIAYQQ